jgi:hypothetical protein
MPDPKNVQTPEQNVQTPEQNAGDPPAVLPGVTFRTPLFGGTLHTTARELSPGSYLGNADYLFKNGDVLGARLRLDSAPTFSIGQYGLNGQFGLYGGHTLKFDAQALPPSDTLKVGTGLQFANGNLLNADWMRTPNGQLYGADSVFKLGKDGSGIANFRVDEPAETAKFGTKLKFNPDFSLNADWSRTAAGQIYGADSAFKLGNEGSGTASFRVDEPAYTANFDTKLKLNPDFSLNADWNRTAAGQIYGADGAFKLGKEGSGTANIRVDEPAGITNFDTKLKFNPDFSLNADWSRTAAGQIYGADSAFKLGNEGSGTASFRVDEPADTAKFGTKLKFNPDFSLNADWNRTAAGQIYGADSAFKLGKDGNGTASFRVDEPAGTANIDTKLKFNPDFSLNADWNRTAAGQIYGADSAFKLGKDGNGTASFRVDEPAGIANIDTKLKFNPDFSLSADWNRTAAGQIYGADGAFKLGKDGSGSAGFRIDEPNGTSMLNAKLKFDENFRLNAEFSNTKNGNIYGADTAFKLGKDGSGTAAFRVDEPANTASGKTSLLFGNGDLLNFDLAKTPNGSIYGADGAFGIGANGRATGSFRIDEPNQTSTYKLGASFDNGNAFNAQLMSDRLGTTLGLDGKLGFDKGAGSVMLDGKFGPRTDLGASINYKNQNLEYGAHVRANNEFGPFKLSEFGAKVSTSGNERFKFSAEAGYRPENNEYYGKVGLTIQLGGGSKRSRSTARAETPEFDAGRSVDDAVANYREKQFTEKQATPLRPENKALYDQATAGVEKLNANGAKLPVSETAASLAALAKQNDIQNIQYVALGNTTSSGQQNLFIGDGDPSSLSGKKAFIDRNEAATAPMQESLRKMADGAAQPGNPQSAIDPSAVDPQTATAAKRSAM